MKIRAIIYDFDGPINDSFREGLRRIEWLCTVYKIPCNRMHRRNLTGLWGLPGVELLRRGLDISAEQADEVYKAWERLDLEHPVPLVPGAKDVLYWGRRNGFTNCILTTRNKQNITDIFEVLELYREFGVISTRQDVEHRKPDPRAFRFVLEKLQDDLGIAKEACIFVGDTREDIEAGLKAGLETLVVQTGPYLLKHVTTHPIKITNILRSVDDLPEWIMENHEGEIRFEYR